MAIWTPTKRLIKPRPNARPMTYRGKRHMVGAWLFSDTPKVLGQTIDYSGHHNPGTLVADTHSVPGKFGNALDFDGTGDLVNCGDIPQVEGIGGLSVSAWARIPGNTVPATEFIVAKQGGGGEVFNLHARTTEDVLFEVHNDSAGDDLAIFSNAFLNVADTWIHIVGTYDGSNIRVYANGVVGGTVGTLAGNTDASTDPMAIGSENASAQNPWLGQIDHVTIYNRVLSAGEVASLYADPFQDWRPEPIELWSDKTVAAGANPKGPLGHPLRGALAGPI